MEDILLNDPAAWLVFSFGIFVVLAFVLGRKSVAASLDAQIDKIRTQISSAETLKSEAEALVLHYKGNLKNATSEAATIIANAQKQADDIRAQAERDLAEAMARREAMLATRIEQMERTAMDDIRRYAAELAVSATTEIIARKLSKQDAAALTDKSISRISETLN